MSEDGYFGGDDSGDPFVVTPESEVGFPDSEAIIGGTALGPERMRYMLSARKGNPDDPPVNVPLGSMPGPDYGNAPGRLALVQGQVYIAGVIVVAQLWLITTALYELLSGNRGAILWFMTLASFILFLITVVVMLWPRRRAQGRA